MQLCLLYRFAEKGVDVRIFASLGTEGVCIGVEHDHSGILGYGVNFDGSSQLHSIHHSRHFHVDNGEGVPISVRNCLAQEFKRFVAASRRSASHSQGGQLCSNDLAISGAVVCQQHVLGRERLLLRWRRLSNGVFCKPRRKPKCRSFTRFALDSDLALHHLHQLPRDRQSKSGAAVASCS